MTAHRNTLLALLGAGLLALSLAPAASANPHDRSGPAYVKERLSLRSGPGMGYRIVGQLNRGEDFEIRRCVENWCLLAKSGPDGWAPLQSLGFGSNPFRPARPHEPAPRMEQPRAEQPRQQPAPVAVQPQPRQPERSAPVQPQTGRQTQGPAYEPRPAGPVYNAYPAYR